MNVCNSLFLLRKGTGKGARFRGLGRCGRGEILTEKGNGVSPEILRSVAGVEILVCRGRGGNVSLRGRGGNVCLRGRVEILAEM